MPEIIDFLDQVGKMPRGIPGVPAGRKFTPGLRGNSLSYPEAVLNAHQLEELAAAEGGFGVAAREHASPERGSDLALGAEKVPGADLQMAASARVSAE